MNIFLSRFSVKHAKLGLSKTLVLPHEKTAGNKSLIASYYTLAASTVSSQDLPTTQSLPRHPIPVALLARRLSENAGFCQIKA
ncbi:MAG: hypothetical protein HON94_02230 [Methylococcales bacterium]|nr:hypothetical protein [Methylococcales bacterium]MBT7408507.1 hypothetical protein [Methylococcales bacterium]